MGLYKTVSMNSTMLAKQKCKLMNGDNGVWAQLLHAKYLKGVQFIHAIWKPGGSYTWRNILSSQSLVSSGMEKLMLNGRTTFF